MESPRASPARLTYWELDGLVLSDPEVVRGRRAASELAVQVGKECGEATGEGGWIACVLRALADHGNRANPPVSSVGVGVVPPASDSTVSWVMTRGQGSCAGLAGAVLVLAGPDPDFEALVLPSHVALRSRKTRQVFELLESGRALLPGERRRFDRAEVVPGTDFPAYYADNLAVRLGAAGQVGVAEDLFREALSAAPRSKRIHFNLGTLLLDEERSEEAFDHLTEAAKGRRGLAEADLNRGVALWKLGRAKEAEAAFRRCLRRDPRNLMAQENLRRLDAEVFRPGAAPAP